MRFVAGVILFLILATPLFAAQTIYVPKGWAEVDRKEGGVTFHLPDDSEGITLGFVPFLSGNPVAELHQVVEAGKKISSDMRAFNVESDQLGNKAECELIFTPPRANKIHEKLLVLKSGKRYLLVTSYAGISLYPKVSAKLASIRQRMLRSLFSLRTKRPSSRPVKTSRVNPADFRFKTVDAGIYWIRIPSDWSVLTAGNGMFFARNARGESAYSYSLQIPADPQTYQLRMSGYRMMGKSQQQLQVLSRFYSPYLSPVDVVRYFYPKLGGGMFQNMQILQNKAVPTQGAAASPYLRSAQTGVVKYKYLLTAPGNPGEREGEGVITTIPPAVRLAGADYWTLVVQGSEAPPPLFEKDVPLYVAIFSSARVNPGGLRRYMQNEQEQNRIIGGMIRNQNNAYQERSRMISDFGQNMTRMQSQMFDTWQQSNLKIARGWMETNAQETPVYDEETGAKFTVPNSYVDYFQDAGKEVRASFSPTLWTKQGDILKPVQAGEW